MPDVEGLLQEAEARLLASQAIDHPHRGKERADAEELLAFVLGRIPQAEDEVMHAQARRFHRLLVRREGGEPVAYITGRVTFRGLELEVGPGAFIPRQSSEFTVAQALRRLRGRTRPVLVDLATGIGPVPLAVAAAMPRARVVGVDVAARPLALARRNARRLGLANATFLRGDLFAPLPSRLRGVVDVVTAHVPYVGTEEFADLPEEVRHFEPVEALTDHSASGDALLGRTVDEAQNWLCTSGWLLMEVSPDRARLLRTRMVRAGLRDVRSTRGGIVADVSRVVVGRRGHD